MFHEVWFIVNYNLYESKRYFIQKLNEAFRRHGVGTRIIDMGAIGKEDKLLSFAKLKPPSLICSFNTVIPDEKTGKFFFENKKVPYLFMLLDPAYYACEFFKTQFSIISCVDQLDCDFIRQNNYQNVLFLPHAVERELAPGKEQEKPYDVVFIGSCYDPIKIREMWLQKYTKEMIELMEEAVEITLSQKAIPFWKAVEEAIARRNLQLEVKEISGIVTEVDNYTRGVDRWELVNSITDARVHVFGGTCWGEGVRGWPQYLSKNPNVTVHPAIPFKDSMEILKKSKICLNSMPFFKNGTHERIFTGLACGSLPVTTENLWVEAHFKEQEELLFYKPKHWKEVNEKVNYYLAHEQERIEAVFKGREKVMLNHTWDNRVEQILHEVPPMIARM